MKKLAISMIGLLILSGLISSCQKDESNNTALNENIWHKKEYKSLINGKEYNLQVEYQEKGRGIKFSESTPKEVVEFFKKNDTSIVVHVVNDKVYYYADLNEFQKHTSFGDSSTNKKFLKAYNGGKGTFFEHPIAQNNGGRNQVDELKTLGFIAAPFSPSSSAIYTLPSLYNGQPLNATISVPMQIYEWHGKTSWVGSNFNDQITAVRADHYLKHQPVHMVCFEHANFGGQRIVISKSSTSNFNTADMRWFIMSYGVFWNTNWDDEISSHYTIQCPAWVMGNGHTIQI
ncbi:MAG: hypothetical protein ACK43K_05615 [Chitinophagales bacterium]|jgi:hypothetical protein|nr:hypothetical protein [Sphingobacteriales bacterium]